MRTGPRNAITDVAGISVGNAVDERVRSGVTALLCHNPAVASVHVMGGAPGTRETDLLSPENTIEAIDGIVLSGGSAFGLDAAGGVQAFLRDRQRGFVLAERLVPLVPGAVIFDLANGGDKGWAEPGPYRRLGLEAANAAQAEFSTGTAGAGYGALASGLKGGLGTASARLDSGFTLGALMVVNPVGSVTVGETAHFWAAPFELDAEFGGLGLPSPMPDDAAMVRLKFRDPPQAGTNTAIGILATDAVLTKAQAKRLAMVAHDGIARAIWPSHTPFDGDTIFSLATGTSGRPPGREEWIDMGAIAIATVARAIARAVYDATGMDGDVYPAWRDRFAAG
jgi:L-aminopeptidase/D-esterase-like protein